ncbi:MAG: hypothetical protein C0519_08585 [Hyphomicrobium sp.]|nr:hypothetical protein [Hyphomicrobium sp.]
MQWATRRVLLSLAALCGLGVLGAAHANTSGGLQARIHLGGQELTCRDFRGQTVRSIQMDDLGDVAHARIVNRMPIITLNKRRLDTLPDKLQVFFFNHECAHHILGHVFYPTQTSENEADCYAIKVGRKDGSLTRADVESFSPYIAVSRGSAFGHLPGPLRSQRLLACFDDPSEENIAEPAGFTPPPPPVLAEGLR